MQRVARAFNISGFAAGIAAHAFDHV